MVHLALLGVSRVAYQEYLPGVPDAGVVSVAKLYAILFFSHKLFSDGLYLLVACVCAVAYFCPPLAAGFGGGLRLNSQQGANLCVLILAMSWVSIWRDRMIHFLITDYSCSGAFWITAESMMPIVLTVVSGFLIGQVGWRLLGPKQT